MGLVIRGAPYAGRAPREQLDVALAAATLEIPLEIYFLGGATWQLAAGRDTGGAELSRGLKGWSAISGLTGARFFVTPDACDAFDRDGINTVVDVEPLGRDAMQLRWRRCARVMVL